MIFGKGKDMKTGYLAILVLATSAALLVSVQPACCAEQKQEEEFSWEDKPAGEHKPFEMTEERIERIMTRLKETNPERAKELEQLQKTEPDKFKAEIRKIARQQIAKKVGKEMGREGPVGPGGPRGPGAAPPIPGGPGEAPGWGMRFRERQGDYLKWLGENYPQEAEKLNELQQENPELYHRQLGLGWKRYGRIMEAEEENPQLAAVLKKDLELKEHRQELLRKIGSASDEKEKQKLIAELQEVVSARYDLIVQRKQIEYEQLRERLAKLQKEVERSEAAVGKWKDPEFKKSSVKAHVEELVNRAEKFDWN